MLHQVTHVTTPRPRALGQPTAPLRGAAAIQQGRGRLALAVAMTSSGNWEHREGIPKRKLRGGVQQIQLFPDAPGIAFSTAEASVGVDGIPHLPGRVPPSGWDGEPGAAAPVRQ